MAVKSLIPALRSALVRMLYEKFGMRQVRIANILGLTQAAVSHYLRGFRGAVIMVEEVDDLRDELGNFAEALSKGEITPSELRERYCKMCNVVRAKGLMCRIHERYDPTVKAGECNFCVNTRYCPSTTNPTAISPDRER